MKKKQFPRLQSVPPFYQDVILGYCKSNIPENISNKSDLYNQILWGNRNLLVNKTSLYSQSFVEAGYIYVKDVLEERGTLKSDIYDTLTCKHHYMRTLSLIQTALKPYKQIRYMEDEIEPNENDIDINGKKCKWFYTQIVKQKVNSARTLRKWSNVFHFDIEWKRVYERKMKNQFEVKIAEFNFKLLHEILPTAYNLHKWKKIEQMSCIYCQSELHNGIHLFYECPYLGNIWDILSDILGTDITWETIVLGSGDIGENNKVVSLLSYVIYKKYLLDREKDKISTSLIQFIKKEITFRLEDYSLSICNLQCRVTLGNILDHIS